MIELFLWLSLLGIEVPWPVAVICDGAAAYIVYMFVEGKRGIDRTTKQVDDIIDWQREIVAENIQLRLMVNRINSLCQHPRNKTVRIEAVRAAMKPEA